MGDQKYVPEKCVWELTLRCNMRCIHCGSTAGKAREKELTLSECLDVADQLLALGNKQTTFIGGEIFLYKGWEKVARRMADGGCLVNIITNGSMMGDAQVKQIKAAGLSNVGVSVDGMRESHDFIRNVKGSYDKVLRTFARLRRAEVPIAVVTTLLGFNVDELDRLYEVLLANHVSIWQIQVATPMGNMAENSEMVMNPEKMSRITKFIHEKRFEQRLGIYAGDDIGYYDEHEMYLRNRPGTISAWLGCQAGLRVVGIDSIGRVKGCESIYSDEYIEGNLREESLATIWNKEGNFTYNRNFDVSQLTGSCAGCSQGARCRGGCRGSSYFGTGSQFENPYCCYPGRPRCGQQAEDGKHPPGGIDDRAGRNAARPGEGGIFRSNDSL